MASGERGERGEPERKGRREVGGGGGGGRGIFSGSWWWVVFIIPKGVGLKREGVGLLPLNCRH